MKSQAAYKLLFAEYHSKKRKCGWVGKLWASTAERPCKTARCVLVPYKKAGLYPFGHSPAFLVPMAGCRTVLALLVSHPCETVGKHRRASLHDPHSAGSSHPPILKKQPSAVLDEEETAGCRTALALMVSHPCETVGKHRRASLHDPHNAGSSHPPIPKKQPPHLRRAAFLVPMAGVEPARYCYQRILSYLLHTEYKRTQPPMEVVDGHQKARNY